VARAKAPTPPPPLTIEMTPQFVRDLKRLAKQKGDSIELLHAAVQWLQNHVPLPANHRPHALGGRWAGYLECHVGGKRDWIMVYVIVPGKPGKLILFRSGKHEDIFTD
jgi:mRNA interferase YafQ